MNVRRGKEDATLPESHRERITNLFVGSTWWFVMWIIKHCAQSHRLHVKQNVVLAHAAGGRIGQNIPRMFLYSGRKCRHVSHHYWCLKIELNQLNYWFNFVFFLLSSSQNIRTTDGLGKMAKTQKLQIWVLVENGKWTVVSSVGVTPLVDWLNLSALRFRHAILWSRLCSRSNSHGYTWPLVRVTYMEAFGQTINAVGLSTVHKVLNVSLQKLSSDCDCDSELKEMNELMVCQEVVLLSFGNTAQVDALTPILRGAKDSQLLWLVNWFSWSDVGRCCFPDLVHLSAGVWAHAENSTTSMLHPAGLLHPTNGWNDLNG